MTTKNQLLQIIRQNCFECMGYTGSGQIPYSDVADCTSLKCKLYEFRLGRDPRPNEYKQEAMRERRKTISLEQGMGFNA